MKSKSLDIPTPEPGDPNTQIEKAGQAVIETEDLKSVDLFASLLNNRNDLTPQEYLGWYKTSLLEVCTYLPDDEPRDNFEERYNAWEKKLVNLKPKQEEEVFAEGIDIMELVVKSANLASNFMKKNLAESALLIGKMGNQFKAAIKRKKFPWVVWSETNLSFIGKRNLEKYMRLAERTDCHDFTFLGIDRMDLLCTATKNSKGKNRIGEFLKRHNIAFDPEGELDLPDFKARIDAALSSERLAQKGLSVDFNLIFNLQVIGVDIDSSLIKTLASIQESGGNPIKHIETLISTGGKDPADEGGTRKPDDFNRLSNRLIQTIDFLIRGSETETVQLNHVDSDVFANLMENLMN